MREGYENEYVVVNATAEDLYRLFRFCEELMENVLSGGTRVPPEELYKIMQAMYALRDASLKLQEGEIVCPPQQRADQVRLVPL